MRKFLIAAVLFSITLMGTACTSVETAPEHCRRMGLQTNLQMRTAVEDWDYFWLAERTSRCSRWTTRIGY